MARKPRLLANGATYHVTARINRQEMIFENDNFKAMFMDVVKRAKTRYSFSLNNFCIMGNHIHFLIETGRDENLSKIMQWILSVFAQRYNYTFNYKGHVWYDRFKSKIIASYLQFIKTFMYISNNPVKAKIVDHPLRYAYSGISYYNHGNYKGILDPPPKIERIIAKLLKTFSPNSTSQ